MLEKILNFSLTQRFLVIIGALLLVGIGVVSWNSLTLDAVPDITTNQVVVNTETPGMGPAEVEKQVTFPIETAMGGIPNVQEVRSLSWYGLSQVTVTFADNVDTYFARQLVNERLGTVREQIPPAFLRLNSAQSRPAWARFITMRWKATRAAQWTCGRYRIGSSARNCVPCRGLRKPMAWAGTRSSTKYRLTRKNCCPAAFRYGK